MLVGGGSGGHITPLLAVAKKLKQKDASLQLTIVSERGGKFSHLIDQDKKLFSNVEKIFAGKLRRYHGESWTSRLFDFKTNLLNIRDLFLLFLGFFESFGMLALHRPDVIFIKGGFVGVPIGLAAGILRIPYITHDSDALAGLTNRLIGSHATLHAVGMPPEFYNYPKSKMIFVGVPVGADFAPITDTQKLAAMQQLGLGKDDQVLLITGGSNGAQRLDDAFRLIVSELIDSHPKLSIIHQVGQGNEDIYQDFPSEIKQKIRVETFLKPLSRYSAAADVIVARGGATAIAEFAAQKKACVIIPNPYLTGGHQLHNARVLENNKAAIIVDEGSDSSELLHAINRLIDSKRDQEEFGANLHKLIPSDATERLSEVLLEQLKKVKH